MATLAQLRSDLRTWTSTHANPAVLPDAICNACVNAAIGLMQEAHLWRGQESTSVTLTYPAAAESIPLPADFVSQKAVYQLTGATRIPLAYIEKTRRDDFIREGSSVSGPRDMDYPQIAPSDANLMMGVLYAIWMELLYLYPPPAQDLTLVVDYWKRFPPLTDDTVDQTQNFLTVRYPHVVRQGALADAYAYLQEDERSATYRQLFEATLTRAILDDKTLMLAGGSTSRGV